MKKLYGLIGCPVSHSMSPEMHNDAFQNHRVKASYHAFHVETHHLEKAVIGLKALGVAGFNVTIPHKIAVIDYLDKIEPVAAKIGAVNTVVNNNGSLLGYNTDGLGFVRSLKQLQPTSLHDKKILLIGAGGAARGIYFTLAAEGVKHIDICNRTVEKAAFLINDCTYNVVSESLTLDEAEKQLQQYDIVINTTSIGMHPNIDQQPISLKNLKAHTIVSDIIYNPLETQWLKQASAKGALTQNGVGMFIYQGALAFEKWTGIFPNIDRMRKIVTKQLGGKIC